MSTLIVNTNGQLIQVAPILQEMDWYFAIDLITKESVWVDTRTGSIREDALDIVGLD